MIFIRFSYISLFILAVFLTGCNSNESEESDPVVLGKLELSEGWARPGSKGQTSAAYLSISNGTASKDSIISISSSAAEKAEIHETFKGENGIIGMRPASGQAIKSGEDLYLKPNGLHIMLMELNNDLAVGDSVDVTMRFNRVGAKTIRIPVKIQN